MGLYIKTTKYIEESILKEMEEFKMKKLLMMGAILALGTTMAYGDAQDETVATDVKVRAQIVAENLVITDLDGNPIELDFGKVSQLQKTGYSKAYEGYKVTYVGDTNGLNNPKLTMKLQGQDVSGDAENGAKNVMMKYQGKLELDQKADKFTSIVALDEYEAALPQLPETAGTDAGKYVYVGSINGTIDHASTNVYIDGATNATTGFYNGDNTSNLIDNGEYIGTVELVVTLDASTGA